jgi:hypothetical protein
MKCDSCKKETESRIRVIRGDEQFFFCEECFNEIKAILAEEGVDLERHIIDTAILANNGDWCMRCGSPDAKYTLRNILDKSITESGCDEIRDYKVCADCFNEVLNGLLTDHVVTRNKRGMLEFREVKYASKK